MSGLIASVRRRLVSRLVVSNRGSAQDLSSWCPALKTDVQPSGFQLHLAQAIYYTDLGGFRVDTLVVQPRSPYACSIAFGFVTSQEVEP